MSLLVRPRYPASGSLQDLAPQHLHARQLLAAHDLPVARVVAVDVDAILYVSSDNQARTAWLTVRHGFVTISDRPGFQAERPRPRAETPAQ
jgi:hypothetical protein